MLREGLQTEMLLLIADNQPLQVSHLKEIFSGDDTQRANTIYSLKGKELIERWVGAWGLTEKGEELAKLVSAEQVVKQRRESNNAKKPEVVLLRKPKGEIDLDAKQLVLKDLMKIVSPDYAKVLGVIGQDLMDLQGVNCANA